MPMSLSVITTKDGSHTLYNETIGEHYHSVNGAITESEHIFIRAGLSIMKKKEISILEIGYGTGLNLLLTVLYAEKKMMSIHYTAIEKYPIEKELWLSLNYASLLGEHAAAYHEKINASDWGKTVKLFPFLSLTKIESDISVLNYADKFDLIYFDAFSPAVQPEMWTIEIFSKIFASMNPGGFLLTYSASGKVKRNLRTAGFIVEILKGPPGKREMTRAGVPV